MEYIRQMLLVHHGVHVCIAENVSFDQLVFLKGGRGGGVTCAILKLKLDCCKFTVELNCLTRMGLS